MIYQWKQASHIKADATMAGTMCEELDRTVGLSAKTLLEANRAEGAPLHNEFEWDDSIAAEEYRLGQARHIISCLVVVQENEKPQRVFYNIERSDSRYLPIDTIMAQSDTRQMLLATALREMESFKAKYASLEELAGVFAAMDKAMKQ